MRERRKRSEQRRPTRVVKSSSGATSPSFAARGSASATNRLFLTGSLFENQFPKAREVMEVADEQG